MIIIIDINALKAAWVKKGFNQAQVANKLEMSSRTLTERLKKGVFGSDEIEKMIVLFDIENPMAVFFADLVT